MTSSASLVCPLRPLRLRAGTTVRSSQARSRLRPSSACRSSSRWTSASSAQLSRRSSSPTVFCSAAPRLRSWRARYSQSTAPPSCSTKQGTSSSRVRAMPGPNAPSPQSLVPTGWTRLTTCRLRSRSPQTCSACRCRLACSTRGRRCRTAARGRCRHRLLRSSTWRRHGKGHAAARDT